MLKLEKIKPTVLFTEERGKLLQVVKLTISNTGGSLASGTTNIVLDNDREKHTIAFGAIDAGRREYEIHIPDIRESVDVKFALYNDRQLQDESVVAWSPMRHWKIHMVQKSHHDIGYTDLPQHVFEEHNQFVDDVLAYCEETDGWPDEAKFRYSVEQSCTIVNYIENRPKETVERLIERVREGRIEIPALYANFISEMMGHEEIIRSLYPSFQLKKKYGVRVETAQITDVPGLSWSLPTILANCGVKYFVPQLPRGYYDGAWEHKEDIHVHPYWSESEVTPEGRPYVFYWTGPDGSRILVWCAGAYGCNPLLGDYESLAEVTDEEYPFDALLVHVGGGVRDNAPPIFKYCEFARDWNEKWAFPKIITSIDQAFFSYIETQQFPDFPVFRGELPNTDYTVCAACTPYETGINRTAHDSLLSAEKFATVAAMVSDYTYPANRLKEAYHHTLIFDEHCWGHYSSAGLAFEASLSEKAVHAFRAAVIAEDVLIKSLNKIVDSIKLDETGYHIVVFNPLSRVRTDITAAFFEELPPVSSPMYDGFEDINGVATPIRLSGDAIDRRIVHPPASLIDGRFDLIDESTGNPVPHQIVEVGGHRDPVQFSAYKYALSHRNERFKTAVVFTAEDVPATGYTTYRIVPKETGIEFPNGLKSTGTVLENGFYTVQIDPETGTIKSIYDKELEKELVDAEAPHGFNQLIVRSPVDGIEHANKKITVKKGKPGPVACSLVVYSEGRGCPEITQEITIYEKIKKIDMANRVLRDATPLLEVYFAFPFRMDNPDMKFEATNSAITPIADQFPGSNTDYYAVQHWVNLHESAGDTGVTFSSIDAHLVELGGLWPGYVSQAHHLVTPPGYGHEFLKQGEMKKAYVYSYVMNNNFQTNFQPTHVSDTLFRYSITSHKGNWQEGRSGNFGWAASNPLTPIFMEGEKDGTLAGTQSFCSVDRQNVAILAVKKAEFDDGIVVRLIETEGKETEVSVNLPLSSIIKAFSTNLVEEEIKPLNAGKKSLKISIGPFAIETIKIKHE